MIKTSLSRTNFAQSKSTACIQNSSCVPTATSKSLSFFIVIFLGNICDFWDQKHWRSFYNQVCTHKNSFITHSIAVFLINVGLFLLCKNRNRGPPKPANNLAEQTEKPIKTHCKPCKNRLWHKKRSKIKAVKEILQIWVALQFLVFSSNKMINKHITMLNWRKDIFCICPDIKRRLCYIVCLVSPWLVCLTCWN